ncbi:MAG: BLUF domain-containing protein [Ramlibacter sp.]|nr:BLUF domain-containing protein [Ramlibacter sp.]MCW5651085.1 BLUF domain-containing protein [Ramlibacter sp.]
MTRRKAHTPANHETLAQLLYCSRKTRALPAGELRTLVERGARRNHGSRISGTLLAGCGLYLQFLEGPPAEIDALWTLLQRDRRHAKPVLVMQNPRGVSRLYPAHPMVYQGQVTPLQFTSLARDVREHVNAHAIWHLGPRELAQLVDRSARRQERTAKEPDDE